MADETPWWKQYNLIPEVDHYFNDENIDYDILKTVLEIEYKTKQWGLSPETRVHCSFTGQGWQR